MTGQCVRAWQGQSPGARRRDPRPGLTDTRPAPRPGMRLQWTDKGVMGPACTVLASAVLVVP